MVTRADTSTLLRTDLSGDVPLFVAGDGLELITDSGERVLDAISGVGVTCLGYGSAAIPEQMAVQARSLQFVHALHNDAPVQRELADRVAELTPEGLDSSFFVSGGSEAVETAIKFVRQYWTERGRGEKWRVVGRWPSFHGSTLATLSVGWHKQRRAQHKPLLIDFPHIEAPNSYRGCGHCRGGDSCTLACAHELERVVLREGAESIAAVIAEPIAGSAGGAFVPDPEYFPALRDICDRHEVLLIADEVITGFGRTGRWFGLDHWGVRPDVIAFAKGISAGYAPLGGIAVRDELVATLRSGSGRFEHNFTMAGHPVACAAGCAVIDELRRIDAPAYVAESEPAFFDALETLADLPVVGDIRGRGFLAGIELVADRDTKAPFAASVGAAERVARLALEERLLVYPCAGSVDGGGDHLLLMPAFVTPSELFGEIAARLRRALERFVADVA
jgi:adenosylmethionine-8-amino-7-oxononanoate aminotransferase